MIPADYLEEKTNEELLEMYLAEGKLEVKQALVALCMKYLPQFKAEIGGALERELDVTEVWAADFDEVRAKGGRRKA